MPEWAFVWGPLFAVVLAAIITGVTSRVSGTVFAFALPVIALVMTRRDESLAMLEGLAAVMVALATAPSTTSRAGRVWLAVTVAGFVIPDGALIGDVVSRTLIALGLFGMMTSGSPADGRIPAARFGTLLGAWLAAAVLLPMLLPAPPTSTMSPVEELMTSRAKVPMAVAVACGLACWPLHTIILDACKRCSLATPAVLPLLGLATLSSLNVAPQLRASVVGEVGSLFFPLGLFTLVVGGFLSLAHEDLRFRLVSAQIGLAGWTLVLWFDDPAAARVLWATVAIASAVTGGVISRLEFRYKSRERNAFRGLAVRHPTAAVTLGFSAIVVAKAAVGPVGYSRGLMFLVTISPLATCVVLVASLVYAAAFADVLRGLLFGSPRVPEYSGAMFERVGKIGRSTGPIVGPMTLLAWGVALLFVLAISLAPYRVLQAVGGG